MLLIAVQFASTAIAPFAALGSPIAAILVVTLLSVFKLAVLIAFYILLAIVIDIIRGLNSGRTKQIAPAMRVALQSALASQKLDRLAEKLPSIDVDKSDVAMGAHIRGVVRPRIVLSGGLLVGLLRNDSRANAIICHEAAHLQNLDWLLPGIIGLTAFEFFGEAIIIGSQTLGVNPGAYLEFMAYKALVFATTVMVISRYREFYADARALSQCEDPAVYIDMLETAALSEKRKWSFFHPSLRSRVRAARNGYAVLRRVVAWRVYLVLNVIVSWVQVVALAQQGVSETDNAVVNASALIPLGGVLLFAECFRWLFFLSPDRARLGVGPSVGSISLPRWAVPRWPVPGWLLRYGFLIGGFIAAIALGSAYGGANASLLTSVCAAIVYGIFRALKKNRAADLSRGPPSAGDAA